MSRKSIKELNDYLIELKGYIIGSLDTLGDGKETIETKNNLLGKKELLEGLLKYTTNGNKSYFRNKK